MIGNRIGRQRPILSPIILWVWPFYWPTGRLVAGQPESLGDWMTADEAIGGTICGTICHRRPIVPPIVGMAYLLGNSATGHRATTQRQRGRESPSGYGPLYQASLIFHCRLVAR